jgi:hypothetical protein
MSEIFFGPLGIDRSISKLLKPIFSGSKKEFTIINNLAKKWPEIVGKNYAQFCHPKSVAFSKNNDSLIKDSKNNSSKKQNFNTQNKAKLTIAVSNSAVAFFLESSSDLIIERIAQLYGYKAIEKIIIKQEPKNQHFEQSSLKQRQMSDLTIDSQKRLNQVMGLVKDKELAEILTKLGQEIL